MVRLLLLAAFVGAVFWFLHWFRSTPPERVSRVLRKSALWGAMAVLLIAVLSGRLNPIFAAIGAAIPLALRAANLLRLVPALQQILRSLGLGGALGSASAGRAGQASNIRTKYLDMRLDHATGALDGTVLEGPFKGRELSSLQLEELLRMHELYRESDAQSVAVLEAYLDREHGDDWRDRAETGAGAGGAPSTGGKLSEAEARSILGVEPGADADAIKAAHRRLMQRLHPDRGGSDYLAAKINQAKRRLIGD
ncbi:DnaJ domain-containing protein [Thiorhodococcus mannitoliphagus]|uniref:DnaJ domain-containing protein n=1 Tax=Thiorhodococcus mannitoliphagus TaxID=329406 RepID=A0A6P1DSB0_9GAMM|nr:DnaJ domain-containing protein [Thiorhodococcus mannitoliphagus]